MTKRSVFKDFPDIIPPHISKGMSIPDLVDVLGQTCFEARKVHRATRLFKRMIEDGDVVWLGVAGAGVAGGMGGMIIALMEAGFIDVICSTGAQVYHDLHFAFDLPVKAITLDHDDDILRKHGDTRIYDIGIRDRETLDAQDEILRQFVRERYDPHLSTGPLASWEFNFQLGSWVLENSKYPERSFVARAAELDVPIFWDSLANHSISMNLVLTDRKGFPIILSAQKDIFDSAAIVFSSRQAGFVVLGGGGPKNFIQQTSPTISQILKIKFDGAERGVQIGTAIEKEGSLSGCTFSESVTWGKYREANDDKLVQVWGEYSVVFPILTACVLDTCAPRPLKKLATRMPKYIETLEQAK